MRVTDPVTGGDVMVLLGLILLAGAVVVAVELILANRAEISVTMWNQTWHLDKFWLAVAGAAILLVGLLGLALMRAGAARSWRIRRERRELAAENRRLNQHVAANEEILEPTSAAGPTAVSAAAPAREPLRERVADRLHHDRNHDGVDDRAEAPRTTATPGYTGVAADSPYGGPADRPGHIPASTAPDPRAAGWTDGRHLDSPR